VSVAVANIEIKLTNGLGVALIDADREDVLRYNWQGCRNSQTIYVTTNMNYKTVYLHRYLLTIPDRKIQVDHINGNGLDNRLCNLRLCTASENHANQYHIYGLTSKYKGVHWDKQKKKWSAKVHKTIDGKKRKFYFGFYANEIDAALAYDKGAQDLFGSFARTNFGANNIYQRSSI